MVDTILEFYQALFTFQNPDSFDDILAQVPQVMTTEINHDLIADFKAEEIETALKHMAPLKSLGPDVMPLIFLSTLLVLGR